MGSIFLFFDSVMLPGLALAAASYGIYQSWRFSQSSGPFSVALEVLAIMACFLMEPLFSLSTTLRVMLWHQLDIIPLVANALTLEMVIYMSSAAEWVSIAKALIVVAMLVLSIRWSLKLGTRLYQRFSLRVIRHSVPSFMALGVGAHLHGLLNLLLVMLGLYAAIHCVGYLVSRFNKIG